jgi:hypothetical protein
MDRAFIAIPEDGRVAGTEREDRSGRCTPSDVIVHYFLDDLSSARKQDLTDHLSGCDLCSARLLALEISAAMSLDDSLATSGPTIANRKPVADGSHSTRTTTSWRTDRRRARRTTAVSVVSLDDRELLTAMALPVDFGALTSVATIEPLEMAVPRLPGEPRKSDARSGTSGGLLDARLWDRAISELFGTVSVRPVLEASYEAHAAA